MRFCVLSGLVAEQSSFLCLLIGSALGTVQGSVSSGSHVRAWAWKEELVAPRHVHMSTSMQLSRLVNETSLLNKGLKL